MKITKVDVFEVHTRRPAWRPVLCRIYTDEGIYTLPPELSYFIDQLAEEIVLSETIPTCRLCSIGECQSQVGGLVCRNAVKAWLLERAKRYLCPKAEAKTGDKRE